MFSSLQTHILIAGHSMASILSLADGSEAAGIALPCPPVDRPVLADFTGDGVTASCWMWVKQSMENIERNLSVVCPATYYVESKNFDTVHNSAQVSLVML